MSIEVVSNEKPIQDLQVKDLKNGDSKENKSASINLDETNSEDSEATENDADDLESTDDENESSDDSKAKAKKKGGFQKRIGKLTARASTAEAERDYWREQALKSGALKEQTQKEDPKIETKPEGRPDPDNFETNAEYIDALTDWKLEQREAKAKANDQEKQAKTEAQKRAETFQTKISEFQKEHSDFKEVIEDCEVELSKDLQGLILESDLAPQLMYDLAKKPEEIQRLNKLSDKALVKALGVLEDRLLTKESESKPELKTSKAPAPINPVSGKSGTTSRKSIYDSDLSQAEYEAMRAEQRKTRRA